MKKIPVLTQNRNTRRQIARALGSGGLDAVFFDGAEAFEAGLAELQPDLLILDVDTTDPAEIEVVLKATPSLTLSSPAVLLSVGERKGQLLELFRNQDISNLVAKHGAIRAVYPILDERELLVTCQKMLRRDIFGIEKYVGLWGADLFRVRLTGLADKAPFLAEFQSYLERLDCPARVAPGIATVAEELILNAMVHAPVDEQGRAKYETIGPADSLKLGAGEHVDVAYGCDGQRLMLSVTDHFGTLSRDTVLNYLARGFAGEKLKVEQKASGAGLGFSMAFGGLHQLIFNIQDQVKTEAIAGWYLRVSDAMEFKQIAKSLNMFWLPPGAKPVSRVDPPMRTLSPLLPAPKSPSGARAPTAVLQLGGRIDENTDLSPAAHASALELHGVEAFTSQGVIIWLRMLSGLRGRRLRLVGCPESLVRLAGEVSGMLEGVEVLSVLCPYGCPSCGGEQLFDLPMAQVLSVKPSCARCGAELEFKGLVHQYRAFLDAVVQTSAVAQGSRRSGAVHDG